MQAPAQKVNVYDRMRQRAQQSGTADEQAQQDALKRKFAAMGNLNSGAYVKQSQMAGDQAAERRAQAVENVDMAEAQDEQRKAEIKEGRDWQSLEAQKGRDFTAGESAIGRKFASEEAKLGRDFSASESGKQRDFQNIWNTEQAVMQEKLRGDQNMWKAEEFRVRGQERAQDREYDNMWRTEAAKQWEQQFGLEKDAQEFNKLVAQWEREAGQKGIMGLFPSGQGAQSVIGSTPIGMAAEMPWLPWNW